MNTSKELSKKLAENGCELESEKTYQKLVGTDTWIPCTGKAKDEEKWKYKVIPRYDILNDICVKYAKECFENEYDIQSDTSFILCLLQDKKLQEAEDYIWEHCKFNPKNK